MTEPTQDPREDRPEWITCVKHDVGESHPLRNKTWCGERAVGFCFVSADHATYNKMNGGRLVICAECSTAIVKALTP